MISTFPEYVFIDDDSIKETRISNMRRSEEFETGPSRQNAYSCKTLYQMEFQISICLDEYQKYLDWYEVTLKQGTQWFLLTCPIRGVRFRYRFVGNDLDFTKVKNNMRKKCLIERWGGLDG